MFCELRELTMLHRLEERLKKERRIPVSQRAPPPLQSADHPLCLEVSQLLASLCSECSDLLCWDL